MKEKNITISDLELTEKKSEPREVIPADKNQRTVVKTSGEAKKTKVFGKKKFVIALLLTIVGLSIGGTLIYSVISYKPVETSTLINKDLGYLKVGDKNISIYKDLYLPEPSEPRTKINPLNGILMTNTEFMEISDRKPVAVMVNNHAAARPQTNLTSADIVYEALTESGITRYMPVYWQNAVSEVGPIRSLRQYYLEWLSEYDAILIHDGYASSTDPRVDAGGNIWKYGIKSIATQGAWRDHTRVAPHNEYSSVMNAMNIGETKGWTGLPSGFKPWTFKNDASKDERGNVNEVSVYFHERLSNGGLYDAKWVYDKNTNLFSRYIAGTPDIDLANGQQIQSKVIILQEVNYIATGDDKGHIILETQGSGNATILMDGKAIQGRWKKQSRTDRTVFYDAEDKELSLNRGQIWIMVIGKDVGSFDIIEQ